MPAFSAINVEPEESVDEEIDDTRQLQIDEALKLFQNALKLHAQGPKSHQEASDAYDDLFKSDIFKYPEASTEFERAERQPDALALESSFATGLESSNPEADTSASSLPQALYLAHKNHGQFLLDGIRHKVRSAGPDAASAFQEPLVVEDACTALDGFDAALDRDPSDAELWRRTARVAAFLRSARIQRYCLEAAIELDDDPAVVEVEPPSLAEGFAGIQLKAHLRVLSDDIALSHPVMAPYLRREMASALQRYLDPLPWLPNPTTALADMRSSPETACLPRLSIEMLNPSWVDLGMALIQFVSEVGVSGRGLLIIMPEVQDGDLDAQMEIDQQLLALEEPKGATEGDQFSSTHASTTHVMAETGSLDKGGQDPPAAASVGDAPAVADNAASEKEPQKETSASQASRKRSQSAAGIQDPAEDENGDTKRSKRIRRRDTAVTEETVDPNTLFANQLQPYQAADKNLFQTTKNMLENFGITDRVTLNRLSEVLDSCASDERASKLGSLATMDLRDALTLFNEDHAKVLLNKRDAPGLGLHAFLEHTKSGLQLVSEKPAMDETQGLRAFVQRLNASWLTIHDVAYEWVLAVSKTYMECKWSDIMKTTVVQVTSRLDEALYRRVCHELDHGPPECRDDLEGLVQTLFELYLDVYERITNPSSVVEYAVRIETKGKLGRWMDLASELARSPTRAENSELSLRFLWASVFSTTIADEASRDHILACWDSLREFLVEAERPSLVLPNNIVIPEISPRAADREISKLTTMDFFLGMFQENMTDPVTIIDTLEPVLNPDAVYVSVSSDIDKAAAANAGGGDANAKQKPGKKPIADCASQGLRDLWKFLLGSNTDLRLFLWSRLGDAYSAIGYTTKQFSCHLRSIELIVADLERDLYVDTAQETRRLQFMQMLKSLDESMIQALTLALNDNSAFDVVDEDHIKSTCSTLAKLNCMLHVAAMHEDEIRIGMTPSPASGTTFQSFLTKLREMQVRTWSLQYTVLKVGISQHKPMFNSPDNDLAEYLAAVHQVLGLRKYCKASNKIFLKMMRVELLKQRNIENWEDYLGQVLYDLHGLKLGVGVWEVQEHGCPPEKLERKNAIALVEKVTALAIRIPMKDLLKSDLKTAIEHMQQAIGQTKSTTQMIHNLRYFTEHLKRPIHPLRLYQAWKGNVNLDTVTAHTPDTVLAQNGWFFLMGMIALSKFKGVDLNRRQTPGATDDLRVGAQYLRLQLQLTPVRWDAWFRLAECFDYDLDELVLWTAEKINKERTELIKLQRNAIHCYTLALSYSHSAGPDELSEIESEALIDMYHNFGMRIYASSREPYAMEAFKHGEQERFFIESQGTGTYRKILHVQMTDYQAWKYAAGLFRRAMAGRPRDWKNPYMYAKCLWKMYQRGPGRSEAADRVNHPQVQDVIDALEKTVEVVSLLPKPRHGQDPILEPHYKILSVVHKLVTRGDLTGQEGADILQRQPYAMQPGEEVKVDDAEAWEGYVIKWLRHLRDKDKSNWQHRLIIRHARILFDGDGESDAADAGATSGNSYMQAKAAFTVLRESMFTKTMVMNVWKCDAERPGRHHVYTEQYVRLMTRLLALMNDRANMEALLRRIRKKGADFYHFNDLWQTCVVSYIRLLRQTYQVPPTDEDVFRNVSPEEFDILAERLTEWVGQPGSEHQALSALKEAVELKKLNANLTKATPIDDLISDCYSAVYADVSHGLPGEDPAKMIEERQRVKEEAERGPEAAGEAAKPNGLNGLNGLSGVLHFGDKEDVSRAGSEAPEKMEKQASATGEQHVRRGKAPGVRKQDIMRRAEQAILRLTEPPPKSAVSTSSRGEGRKSRHGSASSGKNGSTPNGEGEGDENSENGGEGAGDEDVDMKDAGDEDGGGGGGSDASSPPGSVHDSADDESDLSDVPPDYEENAPPTLLFPNLRRSTETATGQESGAPSSIDEADEGDEADDVDEDASSPAVV